MVRSNRSGYMLQVCIHGNWHDVEIVTKNGAAIKARTGAKKTGNPHRVLDPEGNIYVECH